MPMPKTSAERPPDWRTTRTTIRRDIVYPSAWKVANELKPRQPFKYSRTLSAELPTASTASCRRSFDTPRLSLQSRTS